MTDVVDNEKGYNSGSSDNASQLIFERPTGLKGVYYHPLTQVCMLGFVCFMCPGLFNSLNGLGGGGQVDNTTSANSNAALYATFAVSAFFAGSVNNKLGSRLTLLLGTTGYALYIGSYLAINIHQNAKGFVIAAGAILGICAGLLWTAQGSLMLAYPTEDQKGRYIGVFWSIFNLGGVVGASVALGQNFKSTSNSVGNGTYIGFLVLTLIGVTIPLAMADPNKMIRTDGTKVTTNRQPSWKTEIVGLWVALRTDPMIIMLFPMFLASNWFYTWQFNDYNGAIFNIRARALNNLVYWIAQIIGSLAIGRLLDQPKLTRRVRAFSGWTVLFVFVFMVHIWAYFYQKEYTRPPVSLPDAERLDIFDSGYTGKIFLYIFCGLLDAMWQTTAYWLMGAMSNDPAKLAHFAGFYKSIQSAGAAGVWGADGQKKPYMNIFISTWVLLVVGLIFTLPMIHLRVKDHTDIEDETLARMDDSGKILPPEAVKAVQRGDEKVAA
jgi:MFS family permease